MTVLIVGSEGNMGQRYVAICRERDIPYLCYDLNTKIHPHGYDKIIIATPTHTHLDMLRRYCMQNVDILIEKPICKTPRGLEELKSIFRVSRRIYMVNQYAYHSNLNYDKELTFYDYFKTGEDGLSFDCIQLLALAEGRVRLFNKSPKWKCTVNGIEYDLSRMDDYYIKMIEDFVGPMRKCWGPEKIIAAHRKVFDYENENINWYSGEKRLGETTAESAPTLQG